MYLDAQNMFDNNVALTATRVSTNAIDLVKASQNIGVGENLYVYFCVTVTMVSAGSTTLQIGLITDDDAALGSPVVIQDQPATLAKATLVAGFELVFRLHPFGSMLQYLGLTYTVAVSDFTAGKITAGIVKNPGQWTAYPKNYVTA